MILLSLHSLASSAVHLLLQDQLNYASYESKVGSSTVEGFASAGIAALKCIFQLLIWDANKNTKLEIVGKRKMKCTNSGRQE